MKRLTTCAAGLALAAGAATAQVESQWNFDGNLDAAFGSAVLDWWTFDTELLVTFGTANALAAPTPDGGNPNVMAFDYFPTDAEALVCLHDAPANGGGGYVNEYTMIWDVYIPQDSWDNYDWLSFYNTNATNTNDGDLWVRTDRDPDPGQYGVGAYGYFGAIMPDTWFRYGITYTMESGTPVARLYVDGTYLGKSEQFLDGRFSLYPYDDPGSPWFTVISDDSGDMCPGVIASFYFSDVPKTGAQMRALGCVSAGGATTPGPDCSTQPPGCDTPADYNGDGQVNSQDFIAFLNDFVVGCP